MSIDTETEKKPAAKHAPVLFEESQEIFRRVETALGGRLVSISAKITHQTARVLNKMLRGFGDIETLFIYVSTSSGDELAALRLVHLLRSHANRLVALFPRNCASAGTVLALGCEEIWMGSLGYLTAVDVGIDHDLSPMNKDNNPVRVRHDELDRVVRLWNEHRSEQPGDTFSSLYPHIHPLVVGALDRASSLSVRICREVLSYHCEDIEKVDRISKLFGEQSSSHAYPITGRDAQQLGLNVSTFDENLGELL